MKSMLINKKTIVIFLFFLAIVFFLPQIGLTQDEFGLGDVDTALGAGDLKQIISNIINVFLGFLGILATIIILYGGFIWMTAKGNTEQVEKAKKTIINGVIGLVIIMLSYAIASFVLRSLIGEDGTTTSSGQYSGGQYSGGGLGAGILESHYPVRNATDIVRNTNIFVTFKESLAVQDFISTNCNYPDGEYTECVNDQYIVLMASEDNQLASGDLMIKYDSEQKLFEFNPYGNSSVYLDSDGQTEYTMVLNNLNTINGTSVFFGGVYDWNFIVSNDLDTTPPQVSSVIPEEGSFANPRNSIVQINFSEAVNPLTAAGIHNGNPGDFLNISLFNFDDSLILNGQYLISNQYQTVEFSTFNACGENSCGGIVYCLPGPNNIKGIVTTNITDMAGNSLEEVYQWEFATSDEVDLIPPVVIAKSMGNDFSLENPLRIVFSKSLATASINLDNVSLYMNNLGDWNYWLGIDTCSVYDNDINNCQIDCSASPEGPCNNTIEINHDKFFPTTEYTPHLGSGIKDLRQNCWYPCDL